MSKIYRLYVDEVGNTDIHGKLQENQRYLSLTGLIFELDYARETVFPVIEKLKQDFFDSHPDSPIILHRKELVNKKYPFHTLRDPDKETAFNSQFMQLLRDLDFTVLTVVIDKAEHFQKYKVWRADVYHYCMTVLLERYVGVLNAHGYKGDVMAEARGGNQDKRLKSSFGRVYKHGTNFMNASQFQNAFTSKELKLKPKSANVSGLQLADLIAHPSYRAILSNDNGEGLPDNFGGRIAQILEESKYLRRGSTIKGYGTKRLP